MTMQKLTAGDTDTQSADLIADNIDKLKTLFPELVTEGKDGAAINVDVLKGLVGDATVTDTDEKYGLNWHGKRRARQLALTPTTGTLRPCPEDSVDWENTQNLMIEGDNLEVLKLLQKRYAGKVKLIYIDPPYNTGKDFVYPDNYRDNIRNYQELTGQVEGGTKISSNSEASGRFHTDWLNMMYPRLKLAQQLLHKDGAIFISVDEGEVNNLRQALNEIFGEENSVAILTVLCNPRGRAQDKHFANNNEYVVCYTRTPLEKGAFEVPKEPEQVLKEYPEVDSAGAFRSLELRNTHRQFGKHNRPNLYYPLYVNEDGSVTTEPSPGLSPVYPTWDDGFDGCWTWGLPKTKKNISELLAKEVAGKMKIYVKDRADGATRMLKTTLTDKSYATDKGQKAVNKLFDSRDRIFQSPKSPHLLADLVATHSTNSDLAVDFFAGSGTTGHAVMAQNAADGGNRKYILVQLPEPLDPTNKDQKIAAEFCDQLNKPRNIAELTKERLRRAGTKIKQEHPDWDGDTGFRVFKLDSSNIRAWEPQPDDLEAALFDAQEHLKADRSEQDVLYELLLKLGLDLCVPITTREMAGKTVHAVGGGVLMACLAEKIGTDEVEALAQGIIAWHEALKPAGDVTCVFRDSAFAGDVAKTNMAAILEQHGIANVRSL